MLHLNTAQTPDGEGTGNPLQYSCLENPRDRGAWWAAVYGVAQSWTRLKQLSSSSRLQTPHHTLSWSRSPEEVNAFQMRQSYVQLFVTLWPVACQAPLSMGFSRQEYWRGLPCSRGSSPPRVQTRVRTCISCIAGEFFTTRHQGSPDTNIFKGKAELFSTYSQMAQGRGA